MNYARQLCKYAQRRQALIQTIKEKTKINNFKCVVHSGKHTYRSPDVVNRFKPNADYFYLTGLCEPDCFITFNASDQDKVLYFPSKTAIEFRFDGELESTEEAIKQGFVVQPDSEFYKFDHKGFGKNFLMISGQSMKGQSTDLSPYIQELRLIKDNEEQKCIQKSCDIIVECLTNAMKIEYSNENEVDALIEYGIRCKGAMPAFVPVVARGDNAANALHYQRNNKSIHPGQSILVDVGCEYNNYCSDITRTFPNGLNGETPSFRVLYDIVLDVQMQLIQMINENYTLYNLYVAMLKGLGDRLHKEHILNCVPSMNVIMDICPHDVGHHLGIDVHDSNAINKSYRLMPGNVITIEPGVYISHSCKYVKPEFRGYAIRIEDDILINDNGIKNMTEACPKTLNDMKNLKV